MISSKVAGSKVLRMAIHFEYCFFDIKKKRQNGECNVRNFRWFPFGVSPNVSAFNIVVLQMTLNFELE